MKHMAIEMNRCRLVYNNRRIPLVYILMLLALLFRFYIFSGMALDIEFSYAAIANQIQNGIKFSNVDIYNFKWFVILPTALMYKCFGVSDFSSLFFSMVFSLINIYLVWTIMMDLADEKTALMVAVFYSVFPIVTISGSSFNSAAYLEFSVLLTILLLLKAAEENKISGFIYAGISASLIPMAGTSGILMLAFIYFVFIVSAIKYSHQRPGLLLYWTIVVFVFFSSMTLVLQWLFSSIDQSIFLSATGIGQTTNIHQKMADNPVSDDFLFYVKSLLIKNNHYNSEYFGFFGYGVFPATVYCLLQRIKKSYMFIGWFLSISVLFSIGSFLLSSPMPVVVKKHHMIVISLPAIAICVIALGHLLEHYGRYGKTVSLFLCFVFFINAVNNDIEINAHHKMLTQEKRMWTQDIMTYTAKGESVYAPDYIFPRWYAYFSQYRCVPPIHVKSVYDIKFPGVFLLQSNLHHEYYTLDDRERTALWWRMPDTWHVLKQSNNRKLLKVVPVNNFNADMSLNHVKVGEPFTLDLLPVHIKNSRGVNVLAQRMQDFGSGWCQDNHLLMNDSSPGSDISVVLTADKKGKVELSIGFTKAPDFGCIAVFLNNAFILRDFDLYNEYVTTEKKQFGKVDLKKGENEIRFVISGKNLKSRGYKAGVDYISCQ